MVEFGLKLQDNQVAEWKDHYIDYDALKKILKKAKQAIQRYGEQAKKKPELAKEIKANFDKGNSTFITRTPPMSMNSMDNLTSKESLQQLGEKQPDEKTALLTAVAKRVASGETLNKKDDLNSSNHSRKSEGSSSVHGVLRNAVSSVTDYFEKRFETTLRDTLADIAAREHEFDTRLLAEVEKVNNFYNEKLEEQEKRLEVLTENVVASLREKYQDGKEKSEQEDGRDEGEIFVHSSPRLDKEGTKTMHQTMPSWGWAELVNRITRKNSPQNEQGDEDQQPGQQKVLDVDELFADDPDNLAQDTQEVKQIAVADSIQRALVDQYRTAKLLQNFAIMNYTACVKITKKHDKALPHRKGRFKTMTQTSNICNEGKAVEQLGERLELRYANWFCDGNKREANAQLLPKRGDGLEADWSQLRLGYRMGMCAVLGLWVCWDCVWGMVQSGTSTIGGRTAFPVFRACGGLLLLQWFWGCSVFIWTRYRVNYIYLFDFDPRIVSTPFGIFNEAVDNTLFFLWCMLLYYKAGAHDIPEIVPSGAFPMILVMYTIGQLIFPLRTRVPMWKSIWSVISAPSTSPSFYHGYVGDIFTSMVKVFQDIAWTICFLLSGDWLIPEDLEEATRHEWSHSFWYKNVLMPLICLAPLLFRFNQCLRKFHDTGKRFPHLANASKYACSQTVTLFGAFHPLYLMHTNPAHHHRINMFQIFWMAVFVGSSLFSFSWDVFMDWGLGRPEHQFLGPRLMYPRRKYYYYVIAIDLVLRFMWVLTLLPPQSGASFEVPNYLTAMVMMFELFRRTIWGFLRLENEHRSNTADFRRVSFVPLHFNTGHNHKYAQQETQHRGVSVLAEVAAVACLVCAVCVYSVVAAQRATRQYDGGDL